MPLREWRDVSGSRLGSAAWCVRRSISVVVGYRLNRPRARGQGLADRTGERPHHRSAASGATVHPETLMPSDGRVRHD